MVVIYGKEITEEFMEKLEEHLINKYVNPLEKFNKSTGIVKFLKYKENYKDDFKVFHNSDENKHRKIEENLIKFDKMLFEHMTEMLKEDSLK